MEKRLELEKRGKNPADIVELNLDNSKSATIVGLTDEYVNLESLSLINVGLTSLKGFPKLPKLKRLELSDNRISNGLDNLTGCPNLICLNLSGNKIREFENLKPLSDFKYLESLDLFNCEVTQSEGYREKVFNLIPSLRYLDGFDAEDREKLSDDEEDYSENEEDEQSSDQEFDDEEEEEGESSGAVKADDDADDEEDDDDDDDEDDEEEESDDEEEGAGLDQLAGSDIDEEPEGNDFEPGDDDEDDDEDIDDDLEEKKDDEARGQKRKLAESEAGDE